MTVEEPTREECLEILRGLRGKYEEHHHVAVQEEALEAAVSLSERYISDRFLPDKAIDVLDEACAKVSLEGFKVPENMEELEKVIEQLSRDKEDAIRSGDMQEASLLHQEQQEAQKKLGEVMGL